MIRQLAPASSLRRQHNSDDSMIPMINVVFLLLIFFMIAGQVRPNGDDSIELPSAGMGKQAERLPHRLEVNQNSVIRFDGEQLTLVQLESVIAASDRATAIAVLADKNLRADELDKVLALFRDAGKARVTLMVRHDDTKSGTAGGSDSL